ncbi:unnamed protein product [Orchesella dallaii]|uniref:Odorant receptor n=1 Tax=Orchesella dallaii TaxID=48710 RepID=A0ABP1RP56_9HEXA
MIPSKFKEYLPIYGNITKMNIQVHVRAHVYLCKLTKLTPFHWDSENGNVKAKKPGCEFGKWLVYAAQLTMAIHMLYEMVSNSNRVNGTENYYILVRVFFLVVMSGAYIYHHHVWSDTEGLSALFNGIVHNFDKLEIGNLKTKAVSGIFRFMMVSQLITTFGFAILTIACPDLPPFLSSLLPQTGTWYTFILRDVLIIIQVWVMTTILCHGFLIWCCVVLCNSTVYLGLKFLRMNNSKGCIRVYQNIQLITTYTNFQFQNSIQLSITIVSIAVTILSTSAAMKFHGMMPSSFLFAIIMSSVNALLVSTFNSMIQGKLNWMSKSLLHNWKRNQARSLGIWGQKTVKAMKDIRMQFGTGNFFEKSTCLVIMEFQIEQIVNVLLLTN